jgi:leucine-zipper of insertion element IS481
MAVIADGLSVSQVAEKAGVSRQTLHAWLARYQAEGLEGLSDGRIGRRTVRIRCRLAWRRCCWSCVGRVRTGVRGGWCLNWLNVCDGLRAALAADGIPEQILTDHGKVFTGRFDHPPVEVLFDAICRQLNSDLVHATQQLSFAPAYEHRRINVTFLYGLRKQDTLHGA